MRAGFSVASDTWLGYLLLLFMYCKSDLPGQALYGGPWGQSSVSAGATQRRAHLRLGVPPVAPRPRRWRQTLGGTRGPPSPNFIHPRRKAGGISNVLHLIADAPPQRLTAPPSCAVHGCGRSTGFDAAGTRYGMGDAAICPGHLCRPVRSRMYVRYGRRGRPMGSPGEPIRQSLYFPMNPCFVRRRSASWIRPIPGA